MDLRLKTYFLITLIISSMMIRAKGAINETVRINSTFTPRSRN